ncbi:MAG: FAD-binding protein [Deltaproteobacteria bacterium]|nr:FAD-binding protein [Deltaproteobacteria bacterium]
MRRPLPAGFLQRLEDIVGGAFVIADAERLLPYGADETPNLRPSLPDVVVRPGSADEAADVVRACAEAKVFITPRGAGTGKSGGCVPIHGGVVLALDRLTRIVDIDQADGTCNVEPGVILETLQQAVADRGMFYPPDPASLASCTLGGNVAENAGGPRALKYGVTSSYVLGLDLVLPTGERLRTGKRTTKGVAGYDLTSLVVGSEGTLAVVTGITLKLLPSPRFVQTALAVFPSSEAAVLGVNAIFGAGVLPRTLEYLDRASIDAVRAMSPPYRFPAGAGAALLVETDGESEAGTLEALSRALEACADAGATDTLLATDSKKQREIWATRRMLSEATKRIKGRKVSEDIVVPRSKIPEMVARTGALGDKHDLLTCSFGHAGDGNLHTQILFDSDEDLPRVDALLDELFRVVLELGGTITGEHGVGISKKPWLPLELSDEVIALSLRLKHAFDPAGILNPGKVFPEKLALRAAKRDQTT